MKNIVKHIIASATAVVLAALIVFATTPQVFAAAADYQKAQVSFTFDDGFESMYQNAAPILQAAGYKGTLYYATSYGNTTGSVTDDNKPALTWTQVEDLYTNYGWEIGSHTRNHTPLAPLTDAQVDAELSGANTDLQAHGITPTTFAFPEGDYTNATLVQTAKYYQAARGFQDVGLETSPYNNIVILDESLDNTMTLAQAEAFVDQAIANKQWLVFSAHGIQAATDPNYAYIWKTTDFQALVDYVKSKNVPVVTVADAVKKPGINLTANQSFENGFTGWSTDDATDVTVDTNNNGSYNASQNAIKMVGSAVSSHLFSDLIDVTPGKDYLVDAFVNTIGLTSGEFGFYLDEYDANNNWISGQWLGMVANNTVGFFDKFVQATSSLVAKFRVQTYLTSNSVGNVYTDNVNLYDASASASATPTVTATPTPTASVSGTPTPTVSETPTPTATPAATNMITNGSFDNGMTGWTTDNAANVVASASAVTFTGNTAAAHLFQSGVAINYSDSYLLTASADTTGMTAGELGFYIDEYNAQGTWISGQWLAAVVNGAVTNFQRVYKATSSLVSTIRVQTYMTANSAGKAIVDTYSFTDQTVAPTPTVTPTVDPSATVTPTPSVSVTPTPVATNLVPNNSFEAVTSGFADSWSKDTTDFIVDTASNGNDGTNSLHIPANTVYAHAFSSLIAVDATKTYTWSQYVNTLTGTGEFGFYIDEYDATGAWISGQWKGMISGAFTGPATFTYVPSSANVKQVRLQYYTTPNSTFNLFIDSVTLSN